MKGCFLRVYIYIYIHMILVYDQLLQIWKALTLSPKSWWSPLSNLKVIFPPFFSNFESHGDDAWNPPCKETSTWFSHGSTLCWWQDFRWRISAGLEYMAWQAEDFHGKTRSYTSHKQGMTGKNVEICWNPMKILIWGMVFDGWWHCFTRMKP